MKMMVLGLMTILFAGCNEPTEPKQDTWSGNIIEVNQTDSTFLLTVLSTSRTDFEAGGTVKVFVEAHSSVVIRGSGEEVISHDFEDLESGMIAEVATPRGALPLSGTPPVLAESVNAEANSAGR